MDRYRPKEMGWSAPLFAGFIALLAAMLVDRDVHDVHAGPGGAAFHPGFAALALPLGTLAVMAFALLAWGRHSGRHDIALIAALAALAAVALLMVATATAYRVAGTCPAAAQYCDSAPYPSLWSRAIFAMLLLLADLVATALVLLNAIDGFSAAQALKHRQAAKEPL
jgi:tellurite resistance protein TehA-like permease